MSKKGLATWFDNCQHERMESRDTIPCPGADVMCEHCGGTAVPMYSWVFEPNACSQCGHPGRLERDSTGAFYWALLTGKCAESNCDACRNTEVSGLSLAVEFAGIEPLAIPTAAQLIEQAETNAVVLRCPVSTALRALVDDIDRQLSRGRTSLAQVAAEAARSVAQKEIA